MHFLKGAELHPISVDTRPEVYFLAAAIADQLLANPSLSEEIRELEQSQHNQDQLKNQFQTWTEQYPQEMAELREDQKNLQEFVGITSLEGLDLHVTQVWESTSANPGALTVVKEIALMREKNVLNTTLYVIEEHPVESKHYVRGAIDKERVTFYVLTQPREVTLKPDMMQRKEMPEKKTRLAMYIEANPSAGLTVTQTIALALLQEKIMRDVNQEVDQMKKPSDEQKAALTVEIASIVNYMNMENGSWPMAEMGRLLISKRFKQKNVIAKPILQIGERMQNRQPNIKDVKLGVKNLELVAKQFPWMGFVTDSKQEVKEGNTTKTVIKRAPTVGFNLMRNIITKYPY